MNEGCGSARAGTGPGFLSFKAGREIVARLDPPSGIQSSRNISLNLSSFQAFELKLTSGPLNFPIV